jgi:hypothetical protein
MRRRTSILLAVAMVLAVHAWLLAIGVNPLRNGGAWDQLWDPDSYTRLSRVLELVRSGGWYDPTFHGANHPDGFALHWSRLLDALLIGPAWIGSAVAPFPSALFAWGIALAPLLQVAAVLFLGWSTRRLLGPGGFLLLAAFLVSQRGVTYDFLPGIIDHHSLQVFLLLVAMGLLSRPEGGDAEAAVAGAAVALAVWASVESVVIAGALGLGVGLDWLASGERRAAQRLRTFGVAATLVAAVLLPLERPFRSLLAPSFERFSIVQVGVLAVVGAVGAAALAARGRLVRGPWGRALVGALAGAVAGGALLSIFPSLLSNPYQATSALVQTRLLGAIAAERRFLPTDAYSTYDFVLELGPALAVVAWGLLRLARGKPDPEERRRLLLGCGATALFIAYAIYAYRGIPFVSAACALGWTEAMVRLWRWARAEATVGWERARRLALAFSGTAGHWGLAAIVALAWVPTFAWRNVPECRWDLLAAAVPELTDARHPGTVLTDVFSGPEVHFRTGRPVIGSPYHGNGDGVAAGLRLFEAAPETTRAELERREVAWIAICGARLKETASTPWGLGTRLTMGLPPAGFTRIPLPTELDRQFLLHARTAR